MTREPIPGCVILTHDNVEQIIEVAGKRGFTIEHLRDSIDYNAKDGAETILYTSIYPWIQQISNFNDTPLWSRDDIDRIPLMSTEEFLELLKSVPEIS